MSILKKSKGDPGNDRKNGKSLGILLYASCMHIALGNKICHGRTCQPTDHMHDLPLPGGKRYKSPGNVIDEHG